MALATLRSDIAKLRRDQPRNPTSAAVCDGAEEALDKLATQQVPIAEPAKAKVPVQECPVCAERRAARAASMRRYRGKRQ